MTFLENDDNGTRKKWLIIGDVPDARGTLSYDHLKIKAKLLIHLYYTMGVDHLNDWVPS